MPEDNVWLAQRRAEHAALTRLLAALDRQPRTRGARRRLRRSAIDTAGPVPLTLDLTRHRRTPP